MSVSRRRFAVAWLAAFALLAASGTVQAEVRDPRAAEALFQAAKEGMAKGELDSACPRFAESHRLDPAAGTLMNLGACEEARGRFASAWTAYSDARASLADSDFRAPIAEAKLRELVAKIGRVRFVAAAGAPTLDVRLDGTRLLAPSFGVPLPVDPGTHRVTVDAEGRTPHEEVVHVASGELVDVRLVAGPRADEAPRASGRTTWSVALLGLGAVALGTSGVTGLMTIDAKNTYDDHCDAAGCDAEGLEAASRGKTTSIVSPVALGIGLAALAGGLFLLLTRPSSAQPPPMAAQRF